MRVCYKNHDKQITEYKFILVENSPLIMNHAVHARGHAPSDTIIPQFAAVSSNVIIIHALLFLKHFIM
jgi:hypothetical protein